MTTTATESRTRGTPASSLNTVRLGRAFLDRGVPYGLRYHLGFLHWLHWTNKHVDFLSQWDLEHVRDARPRSRRAYDLVVFAGHHEYVTTREYDLVEGYRDLGGNLMFLCREQLLLAGRAPGNVIEKLRSAGGTSVAPRRASIGVQYIAYQRSPETAVGRSRGRRQRDGSSAGPALHAGSRFGRGGVEIDQVTKASPARHAGGRGDPEPLRAGHDGADDVLRDAAAERGCSPQARSTSPAR